MPDIGFTEILITILSLLVGHAYIGRPLAKKWWPKKRERSVDEYSLSLGDSKEFPTVLLTLKMSSGQSEGPFEFVPAFAHQLSDELCVSSARCVKKVTNTRPVPTIGNIEENESA
jgi:hypothetical protein